MDLIHPVPLPQLFVLLTVTSLRTGSPAYRSHLYWDAGVAEAAGRRAVVDAPVEAIAVAWRVLPLEGPR